MCDDCADDSLQRNQEVTSYKKPYLDNCIVSAVVKGDFPKEKEALEWLLNLYDTGKLDLWTSKVTLDELERHGMKEERDEMKALFDRLQRVPFVEDHKVLGFDSKWDHLGGVSNPLVEDDRDSRTLRQVGLDRTDAHHLMLAIRAGCDVFLTLDARTILNRRAQVEGQFIIRLMTPSEFVRRINPEC